MMKKHKVLFICIIGLIIIYLIFAVIPDVFNWSPLPTGGWDWLSFLSVIIGVYFAFHQLSITLKSESYKARKDKQYSVLPCLDVIFKSFELTDLFDDEYKSLVWKVEDKKNYINGIFFDMTFDKHLHSSINPNLVLFIRNIGLGNAFKVRTYVYKIDKEQIGFSLDEVEFDPFLEIYDKMKLDNFQRLDRYGEITDDLWQILPLFNVTNSSSDGIKFVVDYQELQYSYDCIIEFRYVDIYENQCSQYVFAHLSKRKVTFRPISKVYYEK